MKLKSIVLKSSFMLFILLLQLSIVKAQQPISIVSADMPVSGNNFVTFKDTLPAGIQPGAKGANILWDFSSLTPDVRDTAKCMQPSATPYSSTFNGNSNLAITSNDTNYLYFNNTASAFKVTGAALWIDTVGSVVATTFNPAFDLYKFPTEYNGAFTGSYSFTQQITVNGTPVRIEFTSNYADTIDAWGIVRTPIGYYETLRQKRVDRTRTIISAQIQIPPLPPFWSEVSDTRDTTTDYNWLAKETKLAVVDFEYDTNKVLSGVTYSALLPKPIARFTHTNNGGTYQFTNTTYNTNGTTYSWNFGDGTTGTQTNPSHTYSQNGQYTVCLTATNSVGSSTHCVTLNVAGICPTINPNATTADATCGSNDGSAAVAPTGGATPYSYLWSNTATSASVSNLAAGGYTVIITDNNNCSVTAVVNINNAGAPTINIEKITDNDCFGQNIGAIEISVSGGATPYTYEWGNGSTARNIDELEAGSYTVTVTDGNDCIAVETITVSEPDSLQILIDNIANTDASASNGAIAITVVGGTTPYNYSWSNGATSEDITGLACGTYSVTVTDDNGCTENTDATVDCLTSITNISENNIHIYPNPSSGKIFIHTDHAGTINVQVLNSIGTVIADESFESNNITVDLTNQAKGIYFISVSSSNSKTTKRISLQ